MPGLFCRYRQFSFAPAGGTKKPSTAFAALGLLVWWLPNFVIGEIGASEVEQLVLVVGFPIAAIYLASLLIGEWLERRKLSKQQTES
ncbi:MAG: hypothetical protein DMG75_15000 [Acidobacteria bacterium]|nr:MAG: hypothetical protein DMG75_15000 [Acidobacteriota bacterium]